MAKSAGRGGGAGRSRNGGAEPPNEADRIIDAALARVARADIVEDGVACDILLPVFGPDVFPSASNDRSLAA